MATVYQKQKKNYTVKSLVLAAQTELNLPE